MSLRHRLAVLEGKLRDGEVTLTMCDHSVRRIRQRRLVAMIGEVISGDLQADTQAVIDAIGDDGASHIREFIRVMAAARVTAAESELQEESYMFSEDEMNPARADSTLPNPNPAQQPETDLPSGWPLPKITPVPLEDRGWHPTTGKFGGDRQ
jgi:hypothetical protein